MDSELRSEQIFAALDPARAKIDSVSVLRLETDDGQQSWKRVWLFSLEPCSWVALSYVISSPSLFPRRMISFFWTKMAANRAHSDWKKNTSYYDFAPPAREKKYDYSHWLILLVVLTVNWSTCSRSTLWIIIVPHPALPYITGKKKRRLFYDCRCKRMWPLTAKLIGMILSSFDIFVCRSGIS